MLVSVVTETVVHLKSFIKKIRNLVDRELIVSNIIDRLSSKL